MIHSVFHWPALRTLLLCLALAFSARGFAQTPGAYQIDSSASRIEIRVFRTGVFGGLGDNHIIVLRHFSGTAESGPGDSWKVQVTGDANSLEVVDPDSSIERRREVQEKMLGPTQMDVTRYPDIQLRSRSLASGDAPNTWRISAEVTVHGVTRQVEFPVAWTEAAGVLHVRGKETLRLRDFGIEPIRLGLGTVKVKNEFELVYNLVLKKT